MLLLLLLVLLTTTALRLVVGPSLRLLIVQPYPVSKHRSQLTREQCSPLCLQSKVALS